MSTARNCAILIAVIAACILSAFYSAEAASNNQVLPTTAKFICGGLVAIACYVFAITTCADIIIREVRKGTATVTAELTDNFIDRLADHIDQRVADARTDVLRDINRTTPITAGPRRPHHD